MLKSEEEADIFGLYSGADAYLLPESRAIEGLSKAARRVMESQVRQRVVQEKSVEPSQSRSPRRHPTGGLF